MYISTEMVEALVNLLEKEEFDEELFDKLADCKEIEDIIIHDGYLGRNTSVQSLRESLTITMQGSQDHDKCYFFNGVKRDLVRIRKGIEDIKAKASDYENALKQRIIKYAPEEYFQECKYYFYAGGPDTGFSNKSGEAYINLYKMLDYFDRMENVLVHELYHARTNNKDKKLEKFLSENKDKYLYDIFSHILEEGIATLIQTQGLVNMESDEIAMNLALVEKYIKETGIEEKPVENLYTYLGGLAPIYIVGYWVAIALYDHGGKETLNLWTVDFDWRTCIRIFIERTREKGITPRFSKEIEEYLLSVLINQ